jgi:Fe-S-cluster containining protein
MYYVEYMGLREGLLDRMPDSWRAEFIIQCVNYYLLKQFDGDGNNRIPTEKPCLLLDGDKKCMAYKDRPLKCRTYGLVPADMHRLIVESVSKDTKIEKKNLPLCVQCPFVKIVEEDRKSYPDDVVPAEKIAKMESEIRAKDQHLGISKKFQDLGLAFLTLHDWHIMSEMGEEWMSRLTPIRTEKSQEWKNKFLEDLRHAVFSKVGFEKKS